MNNPKTPADLIFEDYIKSLGYKINRLEDKLGFGPDYLIEGVLFEVFGFNSDESPKRKRQLKEENSFDGYLPKDIRRVIKKKYKNYKNFINKKQEYINFPFLLVLQDEPNCAFPEDYIGEAMFGNTSILIHETGDHSEPFFGRSATVHATKNKSLSGICSLSSTNKIINATIVLNVHAKHQVNQNLFKNSEKTKNLIWGIRENKFVPFN